MAEEGSNLLYVPEVLEEQILVRLPVKSILRFKSVCKRWNSLLRSEPFMDSYLGFLDKEALIPRRKDLSLICPELKRRGRRSRRSVTSVIGPLSNGIYALTSILLTPRIHRNPHALPHTLKIALFNPATKCFKFAAPFPNEYRDLLSGISTIECKVRYGIDDDYRVVVLIECDGGGKIANMRGCNLVFLYTWRTKEWEKLVHYDPTFKLIGLPQATQVCKETEMGAFDNMMACSMKLLNGCWNWLVGQYDPEEVENGYLRFGVLSFDFERKSFGLIRGPPGEFTLCADVFVLQGHLAAFVANEIHNRRLKIWRKTTTWTNVYNVNVDWRFTMDEAILHGVDFCNQQGEEEEEEVIKIRRVVFIERDQRLTFDEHGHMVKEVIDTSNPKISLSFGGISNFTPTFESLPL